jgi:hypothetical protein
LASKGYVETILNSLPEAVKKPVTLAFRHVLDNLSIGGIDDTERAANFRWYRFDTVTSSVANQDFSSHHGQGQTPLLLWPIMSLNATGTQIVRLRTTRASDAQWIYLSSPDTGAAISLLVEF